MKITKKYFNTENQIIIKGVAVSGGLAKGKIKLVLSPRDFKNFKKGATNDCPKTISKKNRRFFT